MFFLMCRTPNLKRLVLPMSGEISKNGLEIAMRSWRCLESITITTVVYDFKFFDAIGKHCKNITSLKFACFFGQEEAESLVKYTPNLKFLSFRDMPINHRALCRVLNNLKHLEVVNLWHTDIIDYGLKLYSIDHNVLNRMNISYKIITCEKRSCRICKNESTNDPTRQPPGILEEIRNWREDEIESLAH